MSERAHPGAGTPLAAGTSLAVGTSLANSPLALAIVGGGPRCLYALERLDAVINQHGGALTIHVFDSDGHFGSGVAHASDQARTSYLNRTTADIGFGDDGADQGSGTSLYDWCREKFIATGCATFDIKPDEVPKRYIHGLALEDRFAAVVSRLNGRRGVTVELIAAQVTDIRRASPTTYQLAVRQAAYAAELNFILLVTGHTENRPQPGTLNDELLRWSQTSPTATYVSYPYPLNRRCTADILPPGCRVGVLGMGLTAIDIMLHLTEGRGGRFIEDSSTLSRLQYIRSGAEPVKIYGISRSGKVYSTRPVNRKFNRDDRYQGIFFTRPAIDRLRQRYGTAADSPDGRAQLDFEAHIFPLLICEMACVYYKTLLGEDYGNYLIEQLTAPIDDFINQRLTGIEELLAPVNEAFAQVTEYFNCLVVDDKPPREHLKYATMGVAEHFMSAYPAQALANLTLLPDCKFNWTLILEPFLPVEHSGREAHRQWVLEYLHGDIANAIQGNFDNPEKAACDSVWRDLRQVIAEAVDYGGLTPASEQVFTDRYLGYYNRLSNGASVQSMSKILALVEADILDLSIGKAPGFKHDSATNQYRVSGSIDRPPVVLDRVIEGKIHPFDPEHEVCPLYKNMLDNGILTLWSNRSLHVTRDFHPVTRDQVADRRITILGAPCEGTTFFNNSAAKPFAGDPIVQCLDHWATDLINQATPGAEPCQ